MYYSRAGRSVDITGNNMKTAKPLPFNTLHNAPPAMNRHVKIKFRLYVAGDAPNSAQARANLAELCRIHLKGRHEIEILDVFKEPKRALTDGIFMTPTLVKLAPLSALRTVGNLNQTQTVSETLELEAPTA